MKGVLIIIAVLVFCSSLVAAEAIEKYASGIFEGSMRHVANFGDAELNAVNDEAQKGATTQPGAIIIPKVKSGDFVSVRFSGKEYAFGKGEPNGFYVKRLVNGEKKMTYDFGSIRSKTLNVSDTIELDFSKDDVADARLTWLAADGDSATFAVSLLESSVTQETNETINNTITQESPSEEPPAEEILPEETQETTATNETATAETEQGSDGIIPHANTQDEQIPETATPPSTETAPPIVDEKPGLFARIIGWFKGVFR